MNEYELFDSIVLTKLNGNSTEFNNEIKKLDTLQLAKFFLHLHRHTGGQITIEMIIRAIES